MTTEQLGEILIDPANIRIMKKAIGKFGASIPVDQHEAIMQAALVRNWKKFDPAYRQRFSTSLFRYVRWECLNFIRNMRRAAKRYISIESMPELAVTVHAYAEDIEHVYECMDMLNESDASIIRDYYIRRMTLREIGQVRHYTGEAARKNLKQAMARLREVCLSGQA